MNKNEFLRLLNQKLKNLPNNEREDAIRYYEEYFEEAGIQDSDDVLNELSSPSEIAAQILSEHAIKGLNSDTKPIKNKISSMWFILLALLVSPLAFPIALPIIILLFVGTLLIFIFGFVFVVVSTSLVGAGVSILASGFGSMFTNIGTALMSIGVGIIMIGITVLVFLGVGYIISKLFNFIVTTINKKLREREEKRNNF